MNSDFDPKPLIENTKLIETPQQLEQFFADNAETDVMAVDIESAGFYKYYARVNLIQIAARNDQAIIDPQKIDDFSAFQNFCQNNDCRWIFHGGDYDISMLASDLDIFVPGLFDTRKAAEFLGIKELGLSSLTSKYLGFTLNKKLQRCDWSRRPLTAEMKKYAILDAICLIPIYDEMLRQLEEVDRLEWLNEECRFIAQEAKKARTHTENPFAFRIKGSSRMSLRSLAVLKEVWKFRDRLAEKIDRAPFMVLSNHALLEIARQKPRSVAGLSVIKSLNRDFLGRHAGELQQAVKDGLEAPLTDLEPPLKPRKHSLTAWEGELAKALREVRNAKANRLNVAGSLLAPSHAIYELAKLRPKTSGALLQSEVLHEWQAKLLAPEFIPLLLQEPSENARKRKRRRRKRV